MAKYYYTDPVAAAYMMREFGIKLYVWVGEGARARAYVCDNPTAIITLAEDGTFRLPYAREKAYVCPESEHLFNAQMGDAVLCYQEDDNLGKVHSYEIFCSKEAQKHLHVVEIVKRQGRAFFMPNQDKATSEIPHDARIDNVFLKTKLLVIQRTLNQCATLTESQAISRRLCLTEAILGLKQLIKDI